MMNTKSKSKIDIHNTNRNVVIYRLLAIGYTLDAFKDSLPDHMDAIWKDYQWACNLADTLLWFGNGFGPFKDEVENALRAMGERLNNA